MSDYKEKFEKMKIAGNLASKTLDMLTDSPNLGRNTKKHTVREHTHTEPKANNFQSACIPHAKWGRGRPALSYWARLPLVSFGEKILNSPGPFVLEATDKKKPARRSSSIFVLHEYNIHQLI